MKYTLFVNLKRVNDLTGQKFGRFSVLKLLGRRIDADVKKNSLYWLCLCDCGTEREVVGKTLVAGESRSCGCLKSELSSKRNLKHGYGKAGKKKRGEYRSWDSMKGRCLNPNDDSYHQYGGRGITVCERWANSFESFLIDMGERPLGTTLDRIDNRGDYEPGNCRWATYLEQQSNRDCNIAVTYNGVTYPSLISLARALNVSYDILRRNYKKGGATWKEVIDLALSSGKPYKEYKNILSPLP